MKKLLLYIFLGLCSLHCRDRYAYVPDAPDRGMLVVEALINYTSGAEIILSRTSPLSSSGIIPEEAASVTIEGEDNSVYSFAEGDNGHYTSPALPLSADRKYRMRIITSDAKEYLSDFRHPVRTQEVDSISYRQENDLVHFYAHSSEDTAATYYFKYEWEETWQFNSSFRTLLEFELRQVGAEKQVSVVYYDPVNHSAKESIYSCWQSRESTTIDLGTTEALTESKIFRPVRTHKRDSWELSFLYSILVRQYALSADGYDFYRRMKKNTESLGSIFDAQPSDISGNIRCVTDPAEIVVGFAEFTSAQEKTIFVRTEDLPGDVYDPGCTIYMGAGSKYPYPFANDPEVLKYVYDSLDVLPVGLTEPMPGEIYFFMEAARCVDCTLSGSNVKPIFWP
jgi:hypothetical protein